MRDLTDGERDAVDAIARAEFDFLRELFGEVLKGGSIPGRYDDVEHRKAFRRHALRIVALVAQAFREGKLPPEAGQPDAEARVRVPGTDFPEPTPGPKPIPTDEFRYVLNDRQRSAAVDIARRAAQGNLAEPAAVTLLVEAFGATPEEAQDRINRLKPRSTPGGGETRDGVLEAGPDPEGGG